MSSPSILMLAGLCCCALGAACSTSRSHAAREEPSPTTAADSPATSKTAGTPGVAPAGQPGEVEARCKALDKDVLDFFHSDEQLSCSVDGDCACYNGAPEGIGCGGVINKKHLAQGLEQVAQLRRDCPTKEQIHCSPWLCEPRCGVMDPNDPELRLRPVKRGETGTCRKNSRGFIPSTSP